VQPFLPVQSILAALLSVNAAILFCCGALALEPPDPAEIELLRRTGELSERLRAAEALGTIGSNPIWWKEPSRSFRGSGKPTWGLCRRRRNSPHRPGLARSANHRNVRLLALLIAFPNYPPSNSQGFIHSNLFGAGDPANFPYENLAAYYARSSYGQFTITGNTLGWYTTAYARNEVPQTAAGEKT